MVDLANIADYLSHTERYCEEEKSMAVKNGVDSLHGFKITIWVYRVTIATKAIVIKT